MKVKSNLFSISRNQDSLLAAIVGFILIHFFCKHSGIGISPDSVTYLSTARHLTEGKGFTSFDNLPVVDFPVGYPFLLFTISFFTGLDPLQFSCFLNGILFGILLYLSGAIMNGFQKSSGWYKRIILACILFSPAIQEVYSMLWSETVFLLLILLFMISCSHYLQKMTLGTLLMTVLICAIASLTRYAGLFLIPAGALVIFFNRRSPWRRRLIDVVVFALLSPSFFLVNIFRNYLVSGVATGHRETSDTGFLKVTAYFGGVICDWLQVGRNPSLVVFITFAVILVFSTTILFSRRKKQDTGYEYLAAVMGLLYCFFMFTASVLTRYEQYTSRLLSPMFIPLLWSLSWWIPAYISRKSVTWKWVSGLFFLLTAAWFLNVQLAADYEFYDGVKDAGIPGYQEEPFVQSEIVQYIKKNKELFDPRYTIYSNAGDAVYFISGLPSRQLPVSAFPPKVQQYYTLKNTYLVWFRDLDNPEMPVLDSILRHKNMMVLKQLTDGAVYISK